MSIAAEYDPKTCWHAKELREMGYGIPGHIPDVAWVPRHALRFESVEVSTEEDSQHFDIKISFSEPFRWVEGTCEIRNSSRT